MNDKTDDKERILRENVQEYLSSAEHALKNTKYNVAVTLFFKALCDSADLFLYLKTKQVPSSHSNRFAILKKDYTKIYELLDKDFPFYQDSYTKKMSKEAAEVLRDDARTIAQSTEKI
ncbi:MAG: hypothetical protein Q7K43_06295 [Candidatus Woesearchaeota archaeon]|nr:hypothetical protein [Candidatus Woesearchaeota archaeon]